MTEGEKRDAVFLNFNGCMSDLIQAVVLWIMVDLLAALCLNLNSLT